MTPRIYSFCDVPLKRETKFPCARRPWSKGEPEPPSVIPEVLFLVEQICSRTSQVYNLRASVAIFLESSAFKAVESITYAFTAAHNTFVLVVAEGAFVADPN